MQDDRAANIVRRNILKKVDQCVNTGICQKTFNISNEEASVSETVLSFIRLIMNDSDLQMIQMIKVRLSYASFIVPKLLHFNIEKSKLTGTVSKHKNLRKKGLIEELTNCRLSVPKTVRQSNYANWPNKPAL